MDRNEKLATDKLPFEERKKPDSHVLICGPGKCGGSLLMRIFTELGMDTGFVKGPEDLKKEVG